MKTYLYFVYAKIPKNFPIAIHAYNKVMQASGANYFSQ